MSSPLLIQLYGAREMIDVLDITHGSQQGAQAHFNHSEHKWTVWTEQGLKRTFVDFVSYARYMTR